MAELRPIPFEHLLRRILAEPDKQGTLFDLPLRKAWRPRPDLDLSVAIHGHRAQSPVGPAAGPHAQLAQNIVLAWLGGSRVIELKTVQILDELKIPRPCIDAATVGFNVEWSQELKLADSLVEYVAGSMLIRILRELDPLGMGPLAKEAEPIFELSVGYDLAGLQAPAMRDYLAAAQNVAPILMQLRQMIPREQARLRALDYRADLVSCVTLSTFHGCPPEEIEKIARYLLGEIGVDVIVKLNPTLLGFDEVEYLLRERMGYRELAPRRAAFHGDLRWEDAIGLGRRLSDEAARRGRRFGVKMTNTLVVENHKNFFPSSVSEMYLSGPPLHVLAMHCVERWRAALGTTIPISFSGGIDQHNFVDAVACDLVPVTTCTDLLRPGGYGRLSKYLQNLEEAMVELSARNRDELILKRFGKGAEAVRDVLALAREEAGSPEAERWCDALEPELLAALKGAPDAASARPAGGAAAAPDLLARVLDDFSRRRPEAAELCGALGPRIVAQAGALNAHEVTARVTGDPRYAAGKNGKPPRKVGSQLVLLDCLSCDKCVPVCPNDANFEIATPLEEVAYEDLILDEAGAVGRAPGGVWAVRKPSQWANYADACNECGNCDVFCPEDGGPYLVKARFFGSRASFDASPGLDGVVIEPGADGLRVRARLGGVAVELSSPRRADEGAIVLSDGKIRVEHDARSGAITRAVAVDGARGPHRLSGAIFYALRALLRGALDERRVNMVSAQIDASWPA
ncbi:MAG TPA: 4Fe-4S dicluster domain-containing protein [Polyangia bacterium]